MTRLDDLLQQRLVSRREWGARPPEQTTSLSPQFGSTVHYEGPTLGDYPHSSCPSKVRGIQNFHMDAKGWSDIAYSMMPCRHGVIFECRGRGIRTAANGTNVGNDRAHAVCALIGENDTVPDELFEAVAVALAWLNEPSNFGDGVNGHRDWKPTACPGTAMYARLGSLRARVAALLAGGPALPPPPASYGPELLEDSMRQILVPVPVDQHRGYVDLRKGFAGLTETISSNRVVSFGYAGDNPSDGWGPSNRRAVELVNVGGVARIVVPEHDLAVGTVQLYVTIADAA